MPNPEPQKVTLPLWARLVLTVRPSVTVVNSDTGQKTTFTKAEARGKTVTDLERFVKAAAKRERRKNRNKRIVE
jgi:hypothetical protein